MIEQPTVFILGAGAHCSYGFPSGKQLKADVVSKVRESVSSEHYDLAQLGDGQITSIRCEQFAEALENAGQPSIDAFLNANSHLEGFENIGKAGIAQALLDYEERAGGRDDDWLTYLFEQLIDGINNPEDLIAKNKIGFITFNYDRFLETWLHQKIKHSFGLSDTGALAVLNQIPIHHIYGMLGTYPPSIGSSPKIWIDAAMGIRTIFDSEQDPTILNAAKNLLDDAKAICLLGFGFHRENIDILDLRLHVTNCSGLVFASRMGYTEVEFNRLKRPFKGANIRASYESERCLAALRKATIF